ncbi:gas vesicle protein [Anoxybacillus tepidamans]|uniref:Gas vesicle protein n=1 Tax=Anoxybacteroides tepidamans TaxID=265948 RepID=A0A7W8IQS8_9BACL|nr:YtxH domain-containing protein [Anoxybacillus tepidamans]MBB5325000.1 gas vesicle protein [Anoxybacillus tepidamans]
MKLWKNVMIGAALGAAVSLLDRETREALKTVWRQREEWVRRLPEQMRQCRQSLETLTEDVIYTAEKIKVIAEKTPEMIEWMKETYDMIKAPHSKK